MSDYRTKKLENLEYHSEKRAMERFGIKLDREARFAIHGMIHEGQTRLIQKRSLRRSIHELTYEGKLIHVVYDHKRHSLVTFLMPGWSDDEYHQSVRRYENGEDV